MKRIDFSYNWNNKLDCKAFTSIRRTDKYNIDDIIQVYLNDKYLFNVQVIGKKYLIMNDINDYIGYLDTGYSAEETKNILKDIYKNEPKSFNIYYYLFKRIENEKSTK